MSERYDIEVYLLNEAQHIESEEPLTKCLRRLAGALRAAAADVGGMTEGRLRSYIAATYRKPPPS